ncbi:MAG: hypothetical protein CM1200mP39_29580 [Dehalococcoidia bacterium]|nr:MAG: hypothetical protein CM1200mP39_29580 [Dehalococcoidia bacterium]
MRHVFFAERAAGKIPGVKKTIEPRARSEVQVLLVRGLWVVVLL